MFLFLTNSFPPYKHTLISQTNEYIPHSDTASLPILSQPIFYKAIKCKHTQTYLASSPISSEFLGSHTKFYMKTTSIISNTLECIQLTCLRSIFASAQFQWIGPREVMDEYAPSLNGRTIFSKFAIRDINGGKDHLK